MIYLENNTAQHNLTFTTENRLSTINFSTADIIKFTKALDPNTAHGHNGISISVIKLCLFNIKTSAYSF